MPQAVTARRALLPYETVEERRQPRGSRDTPQVARFDFVRAPGQRAFRITLLVAFLLHLPFVPTRLFTWLSILWNSGPIELNDIDGEVVIPIDFDLVSEQTNPAPAPTAETNATVEDDAVPEATATATTTPKKPPPVPSDAGVDAEPVDASDASDASSETPEAGVADAAVDAPADATADAATDAGPDDAGINDAAIDSSTNDPDASDSDAAAPIAQTGIDGGSGGILPASTDAGLPIDKTTNLPDAGKIEDAGAGSATDGGSIDAGPIASDPSAVAGAPSSLVGKDPNVKILIAGERLRKYELGGMFGEVLAAIPQWQTFIGTSGIDPVKDVNHMLIGGPQLRDSRKVVVVLDMGVSEQKTRETVNGIIKRSNPPGKWLDGTPVPAAMGQAAGGERIFALVPGKHMIVVLPADAKDQLPKVKAIKPFDKSSKVGIALYMVTPANAFRGLPFQIPNTLKWMRINVIPTDDSGVDVVLEAQDKDETLAREHAVQLEAIVEAVRKIDVPFLGSYEVLPPTPFVTVGSLIRAETHVSRAKLILIMGEAKRRLKEQAKLTPAPAPKK